MRSAQISNHQEGRIEMLDGFDVLQAWLNQKELPHSWQLAQRKDRASCFLSWLSVTTDCESSAVVDSSGQVLASVDFSDAQLSLVREKTETWKSVEQEDGAFLHWTWVTMGDRPQGLALVSSLELEPEFLQYISEIAQSITA